ncbi:MAG: acetate--CoA ligase family protein, partial [Burkholderiales bacterium]
MTVRNLEFLFRPKSIAVIGASDRQGSVGATVIRNVLAGGFSGPVYPVNRRHAEVAGRVAFSDVTSLPEAPDLAVIATPPAAVPEVIGALGARGTRAAVVLTAGLAAGSDGAGRSLTQAMLEAARPHLLRILGPNCVGLLVPGLGINASFAHTSALPGNLAFVSQSGGLTTAVLDWARSRGIGFSHFISLGDAADVDFGDVLDYLASDPATRAILLYIESVRAARKFMSAARAAARNKPVLAVKAGRVPEGARAAASHTGALAGADDVYDAAIRRAGMLRVDTVLELFDAVETLSRAKPVYGDRLAIMTNGGGPGVMATDALV